MTGRDPSRARNWRQVGTLTWKESWGGGRGRAPGALGRCPGRGRLRGAHAACLAR